MTNETIKIGDIFTNGVNFFEVIATKGKKTVTVRQVCGRRVDSSCIVPCKGEFMKYAEPRTRRVMGDTIKVGAWDTAYLWDGQPMEYDDPQFI